MPGYQSAEGISNVERLARGLYRLAECPPLTEPDLITVAKKIPNGVICLISALAFHDLTTQIPHAVDVAIEQGSRRPRLKYSPIRIFWFSGDAWHEDVVSYPIDGVPVPITDPAKSIADSFKYRRKLGPTIYTALGLNIRQVKAMQYLEEHGEITSSVYCSEIAPNISQRMARKDLRDLEERGLVSRIGQTRGTRYVLPVSE